MVPAESGLVDAVRSASGSMIRFAVICAAITALTPMAHGVAAMPAASDVAAVPAAFDVPPAVPVAFHVDPVRQGTFARADLALISSLDARTELLSTDGPELVSVGSGHDPSKMFLVSLAIPGSGELVQGKKRGYLFLLAEIAMWSGFYVLDKQGLDERSDYESFADANWDYESYIEFYNENCLDSPHDYVNGCRPLADYGSQEFYEDVGKYDVYWPWWGGDGVPNDPTSEAIELRN